MHDNMFTVAAKRASLGGIIAYPTESVYGLGCDPKNATAISRLMQLKARAPNKGFILIGYHFDQLAPYCSRLPEARMQIVQAGWPGGHTWVFPASKDCPKQLCGANHTIAVRVTAHVLAAELCRVCNHALVSTSANQAGETPARTAAEVLSLFTETFTSDANLILVGKTDEMEYPSVIRNALTNELLRGKKK